jgi:hypothetical protein
MFLLTLGFLFITKFDHNSILLRGLAKLVQVHLVWYSLNVKTKNFKFMNSLVIFVLIPLTLTIGLVPALPFSQADFHFTQICMDKVWIESTKGRIACVTSNTAEKLVQRGWGTLL